MPKSSEMNKYKFFICPNQKFLSSSGLQLIKMIQDSAIKNKNSESYSSKCQKGNTKFYQRSCSFNFECYAAYSEFIIETRSA